MAILKCKMCGGNLNITEGISTAECEYCGSLQTVPKADDEKKLTLFARANRLRAACDFDKAAGIYETIVADFPEEAEAYWGLVLCKYGIEYVDDPASGKKIPTCHRSSFDSVMDDSDFDQTIENADVVAVKVYREEAKAIEEIRKGIVSVSAKEEPYDIFICYKETANDGERTIDSVLAQDVYDALTEKGYRVFFSRISLEDKLGAEYEPYIFAALNSAKIMLVFGTDYSYFNAVWVKNEWSRFLKLMAQDKSKHLIPCYKGIDAYDMPKEFAKLQAQDLGKVGATQDLLRGIDKILAFKKEEASAPEIAVAQHGVNPTVDSYLKRASMFLEEKNWSKADEFCEKVLNAEPENSQAYLVKLLAEMKAQTISELSARGGWDRSINYQRCVQFGDAALKKELSLVLQQVKASLEYEPIYAAAIENAEKYKSDFFADDLRIKMLEKQISILESISFYKDAEAKVAEYKAFIRKLPTTEQRSGCYIATAVYGSYDCPQVWTLRRFRDDTLAATWYGRAFIHTYYAISPTLVKWFGEAQWFKKAWKQVLDKMVHKLQFRGVDCSPYEDKKW